MENHRHLGLGYYVCFTQAGFKQSLYHNFRHSMYDKEELKESLQNFPTEYPCVVNFIDSMSECRRTSVQIFEVEEFQGVLNQMIKGCKQ